MHVTFSSAATGLARTMNLYMTSHLSCIPKINVFLVDVVCTPMQMLSYAVVAEYYCPADSTPYLGFLSESLESDTNGLQAFIGKSVLVLSVVCKYHYLLEGEMTPFFFFFLLQRTTF